MNPQLHHDVINRLQHDFHFKHKDNYLRQGTCPSCHKKELYGNYDEPWVIRCGRLNKCGAEFHIKDLYPELFMTWSNRYPVTETKKNAAAEAYLTEMRGFSLEIINGIYTQESYFDSVKQIGSATVRFKIKDDCYWERIIDKPFRFDRKANFRGNYGGSFWAHPRFDLTQAKKLWIVEGIFDAIALLQNGIFAVSIMSSVNYPEQSLQLLAKKFEGKQKPTLVWALDNDNSGHSFIKKHIRKSREQGWLATSAQTPNSNKKLDWNDLHQLDRLKPRNIQQYLYFGELLIAESAIKKAMLIHEHTERKAFHFVFDNELYWFKIDLDRFSRVMENAEAQAKGDLSLDEIKNQAVLESGTVANIANCNPQPLYFQENKITDESWYYFKIGFPDKPSIKNTITAAQLASSSEFKKRLLHVAQGAMYTGSTQQLDLILKDKLPGIKKVEITDFVGYSKEYDAYIYNDYAIKDGRVHHLNDEDFFDIGKLSVKTINQSVSLSLNPDLKEFNQTWQNTLWTAFGAKGFVALSFWFGSLFAEQIRNKQKSYPFLEVMGEPGTGKTTLIEFMWKLCGRTNYEGFDPSKSTLAARARNFSQVSNMPIVLIEGDRGQESSKQKGFDWDELKTAYNGRSVRSRGMRNNGNETYEPPFRGAIVIAQNAEVNASEAVLQRIIHIFTDRSNQNATTKKAAEELERMPVEQLSQFLLMAAMNEKKVLAVLDERTVMYEQQLERNPEIKNIRIIKNHAQLMALADALTLIIKLEDYILQETKALIEQLAVERQKAINADHPAVAAFFEVYEYLNGFESDAQLNHSKDPNFIAINLNQFVQMATEHKQQIPQLDELKRVLKTGRSHKFIDIKSIRSNINEQWNIRYPNKKRPTVVKCWVFQK